MTFFLFLNYFQVSKRNKMESLKKKKLLKRKECSNPIGIDDFNGGLCQSNHSFKSLNSAYSNKSILIDSIHPIRIKKNDSAAPKTSGTPKKPVAFKKNLVKPETSKANEEFLNHFTNLAKKSINQPKTAAINYKALTKSKLSNYAVSSNGNHLNSSNKVETCSTKTFQVHTSIKSSTPPLPDRYLINRKLDNPIINQNMSNDMPSRIGSANFDLKSTSSESIGFEKNIILALIAKEKCGQTMDNAQIEASLNNNLIDLKHRATPFNEEFLTSSSKSYVSSHNSISNELNFLELKKKNYLQELERFRNFPVSDYYFSNMHDFRKKLYKTNDRVRLSDTSAPNTSNELFNRIEKFDVAEAYKKKCFQTMPDIHALIKKNQALYADIKASNEHTPAEFRGFRTMRHFHLRPDEDEDEAAHEVDPPLMQNRSEHKQDNYSRLTLLINSMKRVKTAV